MTTNPVINEIETALLKKLDTAKRFRDQAAKAGHEMQKAEWGSRAGAYGSALKIIREICEEARQ